MRGRAARVAATAGLLATLLGAAAGLTGCCTTAAEIADRGDLDVTMSRHHVDLRWGRVPNAARFVHPDLRPTFVEDWQRRLTKIELTEVEVVQVFHLGEGIAEATIRFAYVDKTSLQLKEHVSSERWELTDGYWLATRVAELDDAA